MSDRKLVIRKIERKVIVRQVERRTVRVGIPGRDGVDGDKHYLHTQGTPSAVWTVHHGLGKRPSVEVLDSAGSIVEGSIQHDPSDPLNIVIITFSAAFSGLATFN